MSLPACYRELKWYEGSYVEEGEGRGQICSRVLVGGIKGLFFFFCFLSISEEDSFQPVTSMVCCISM